MTPQQRTALITRAKQLAVPVASCVAASIRPDHLLRDVTDPAVLLALITVLAEAADPVRLREVVKADDGGGTPSLTPLAGHRNAGQIAQYAWLRREGKDISEAAAGLGIAKRTAERYEQDLVAAGEAAWERRGPGRAAA